MNPNDPYMGPIFTADHQGRIRTWPLLTEELDEWNPEVPTEPLPVLVQPGVLHIEEVGSDG